MDTDTNRAGPSCKKQSYKKQKRSVDPSFLSRFGIADMFGKAICVMCSKEIAEESLKPNKLMRHMKTHANVATLADDARKRVFMQRFDQLTKSQGIMKQSLTKKQRLELFSYKTAFIVAREKRPFVEGEVVIKPVLESFVEVFDGEAIQKSVRDAVSGVALSNNTITRRIENMADDLREQIYNDFRSSRYTALAIDESTDITSEAQLLVYGRFIRGCRVVEELLACLTLHLTTTGHDIFSAVDTFFTKNNFNWDRVVECCIDGAPSMMGKNIGFRGILCRKYPHIKFNHCIIHREALASRELSPVFSEVMQVVIKVVNFVKSRDLNCRLFKDLCSTENAEHSSLLLYTAVRWLSRGSTLKRVFILRNELREFLHSRKNENANYFANNSFLAHLALLTDIFDQLNDLNTSLQGRGKWVFELQTSIRAFCNKLNIFIARAENDDVSLFPHYQEYFAATDNDICFASVKQDFIQYITKLKANFKERFPELDDRSYQHIQFPFRVHAEACGELALELADLQADFNLKLQFEDSDLASFWLNAPKKYVGLKTASAKTMVQFGSTYVCESTFSCLVYIKSKYRNRISNSHLEDNLIIATTSYDPRFRKLAS